MEITVNRPKANSDTKPEAKVIPKTDINNYNSINNHLSNNDNNGDNIDSSITNMKSKQEKALQQHKWRLGLILLGVVVFLWVASNFLVNDIFESGTYRKPYFVTYLNTGTFSIYMIPSTFRWIKSRFVKTPKNTTPKPTAAEHEGLLFQSSSEHSLADLEENASLSKKKDTKQNTEKFTTYEIAKLASQFSILWYLANFCSNASLSYTSVGSSTLLTSTSSFFTLIVGSFFGVEKVSIKKIGALAVSILGIALINREEQISTSNSVEIPENGPGLQWLGNVLALASALLYGIYTTLLKVRVGEDEERINMFHFFGFVGIFNTVLLWPVIVLFDRLGIESFSLPPNSHVWFIVLINASSTVISDFCWAIAMLLTSPLVVTVGLSATIPMALAGDMILKSHFGTWLYYVGALLMCAAFFAINKQENEDQLDNHSTNTNRG